MSSTGASAPGTDNNKGHHMGRILLALVVLGGGGFAVSRILSKKDPVAADTIKPKTTTASAGGSSGGGGDSGGGDNGGGDGTPPDIATVPAPTQPVPDATKSASELQRDLIDNVYAIVIYGLIGAALLATLAMNRLPRRSDGEAALALVVFVCVVGSFSLILAKKRDNEKVWGAWVGGFILVLLASKNFGRRVLGGGGGLFGWVSDFTVGSSRFFARVLQGPLSEEEHIREALRGEFSHKDNQKNYKKLKKAVVKQYEKASDEEYKAGVRELKTWVKGIIDESRDDGGNIAAKFSIPAKFPAKFKLG